MFKTSVVQKILLMISVTVTFAAAQLTDTDWYTDPGTTTTFYIATSYDLAGLAELVNNGVSDFSGKIIRLTNNIDLTLHLNWTPIGNYTSAITNRPFSGTFHGGGYVISNLNINRAAESYQGLFGYVQGGRLDSLWIENVNISGGSAIGSAAGRIENSVVDNSYATGSVSGAGNDVGGLVGSVYTVSQVIRCYFNGTVSSTGGSFHNVGGLAGSVGEYDVPTDNSTIDNCYSAGTVRSGTVSGNGVHGVGGLVGAVNGNGRVNNCYSISAVSGFSGGHVYMLTMGGVAGTINSSRGVINSAALNPEVKGVDLVGRVTTTYDFVATNNVAFSGMLNSSGTTIWGITGLNTAHGADITAAEINSNNGTIGGLFTSANGWTTASTKLPGLFGEALDMPAHLGGPIGPIVAVTGITGVPTTANAGTPLALTGTVAPTNATFKAITWSVVTAGTTGATISGSTLNTTASGTVRVRAAIVNGIDIGENYTQEFDIAVTHVPVTGITGVPTTAVAGTPLALTGTVLPANATNKTITWNINIPGTTGATITGGNILNTTATGTVSVMAMISGGDIGGTNYVEFFTISVTAAPVFVPVTDITGVPATVTVGTDPFLGAAAVVPVDATNKTISWSIPNNGGTGTMLAGNYLYNITSTGTITVRATVSNGTAVGTPFTKDFQIAAVMPFVAVTSITGVPLTATVGISRSLTGTVNPSNATNKTIVWSVQSAGTTGAVITGGALNATSEGTVTVRATIANGTAAGTPYTQDFNITVGLPATFFSVENIINVPAAAMAGEQRILTGTVVPFTATNQTIVWSVASAGTTGASVTGNILSTTASGTVTVTASVTDGTAVGTPYTKNFTVTVSASGSFAAVESITGVPAMATGGVPLPLTGTVVPSYATNKTIEWSVFGSGGTGAVITNGILNVTGSGTLSVRAVIANGEGAGRNYVDYFYITVNEPVTAITGVPAKATVGIPLSLRGTVVPSNATSKTIVWSVSDAGGTGAVITGSTLTAASLGTVTVRAAIANGLIDGPYTQEFPVTVAPFIAVTDITDIPAAASAGEPFTLSGMVSPADATYGTIVWSVANAGTTGAQISGNILSASDQGTIVVKALIKDGKGVGEDFEILVPFEIEAAKSILSNNRVTPPVKDIESGSAAPAVTVFAVELTAGPNPVMRPSGVVNFFVGAPLAGARITGALTIFDAQGNMVNRVQIKDKKDGKDDSGRRIVGSWDLKDSRGRAAAEGVYLVRGVVTVDGKKERVSVMVGVR